MSCTIGILAIQGDFAQHELVFDAIKNKHIFEHIKLNVILVRDSKSLSKCDGLIIPGGESTTIGLICNDYNLIDDLKQFVNNEKKYAWGVCAGLILLSNKLVNNQKLTHFEAKSSNDESGTKNEYTSNSYDQPIIGGLNVVTHRNFYGSQCNSSLKKIYIIDEKSDNNKIIESQSHFIRSPMIMHVGNEIDVLSYIYDESKSDKTKLITCVHDAKKHILGTVFHPEVTYFNNKFDDVLNSIDTYWHEYFLQQLCKLLKIPFVNPQNNNNNSNNNIDYNINYNPCPITSNFLNNHIINNEKGSFKLMCNSVNRAFPLMLHGGVIMDVVNATQARIAEEAGACSVMALERIPADIKKDGGIARMSDPYLIKEIKNSVSIPIMAKTRIGHFGEARILETIGIDCIDESEVLTAADEKYHINKHLFNIPFVCGAKDLGEALRRINEGAAMIRLKGNAGTGNVMEAVRHARLVFSEINKLKTMNNDQLFDYSKEIGVNSELVYLTAKMGRLPVTTFAAGGIATPADVLLMMSLGCDGVFVGSGIFKSSNPAKRARAIVHACSYYQYPEIVCKVSENLGKAMVGVLHKGEKYQFIHNDSKL